MSAMNILAIETSGSRGSVAWREGSGEILARELPAEGTHSTTLLPAIQALLAEAGKPLGLVDCVAFGAGPGSFTGVRLACGAAQGLAMALDRPVCPVSTLQAVAWACGARKVLVALDARMQESYLAAYQREAMGLIELLAPAVGSAETLRLPDGDDWVGAGNGFAAYPRLAERLAGQVLQVDEAGPQASAVAELAAFLKGGSSWIDAAEALPIYVRNKVALTVAERRERGMSA